MLRYDHLNMLGKVAYHLPNPEEGIPEHGAHTASGGHPAKTAAPSAPTQVAPEGAVWQMGTNPYSPSPGREETYGQLMSSEGALLGFGSTQAMHAFQQRNQENWTDEDFSRLSLYAGAPAPI